MKTPTYNLLKQFVNLAPAPCTALTVERKPDGTCGEIRFFAVNDAFKRSFYDLFIKTTGKEPASIDELDSFIEGQPYTISLSREPKFEEICFRSAWNKEYIHTYVDTTSMYGYWTEDFLIPCDCDHEENISYCYFIYQLNREMDTGKFSAVSPDISSYVIKACLELRNENEFYSSMNVVIKDLREYTDSINACILTVDSERKTFQIISESVKNNVHSIKEYFETFPYEIIASWEDLVKSTNNIIIKDENDMDYYETLAPSWVKTMKEAHVKNLCLSPFVHHGEVIGYLYLTDFDGSNLARIKEVVELLSFFLTAEVANHTFLEKLEYLSNVDMLTGVFNRNCMNVNVDELSLKLKLEPKPFSVAFFDLNGLKSINDHGGHNSGDALLKDAANVLKEIFPEDQIYRAGGDEFVVISLNDSEDDFLQKLATVRAKACDPDWLNFAIGHYHDDSEGNLRLAMRYADENMYEDKNAFYDAHPEKRR